MRYRVLEDFEGYRKDAMLSVGGELPPTLHYALISGLITAVEDVDGKMMPAPANKAIQPELNRGTPGGQHNSD